MLFFQPQFVRNAAEYLSKITEGVKYFRLQGSSPTHPSPCTVNHEPTRTSGTQHTSTIVILVPCSTHTGLVSRGQTHTPREITLAGEPACTHAKEPGHRLSPLQCWNQLASTSANNYAGTSKLAPLQYWSHKLYLSKNLLEEKTRIINTSKLIA